MRERARPERWAVVVACVLVAGVLGRWTVRLPVGSAVGAAPWPALAELDSLAIYLAALPEPGERTGSAGVRLAAGSDPFDDPAAGVVAEPAGHAAASAGGGWRVSAILEAGGRRVAIVNDVVVGAGDLLPGGARVDSIGRDRVSIVERGGARRTLRMEFGGT
jgi:hypothetical protein